MSGTPGTLPDGFYIEIDEITYGITRFFVKNGAMTALDDDGQVQPPQPVTTLGPYHLRPEA